VAIAWRDDLLTGNEEIDNQHKELFARFNALLDACDGGRGKEEVSRLLQFLAAYVKEHFAAEELLQASRGFPDYPEHRRQHEEFVARLARLREQFEQEGATLSLVIETNQMMVSWLINHISAMDKKFGAFLQSRP
jgi:hemerythrin